MVVIDYLLGPVPQDLDPEHQFRLLWTAFAVTFTSVIVVHGFLPNQQPIVELLSHSAIIALTYTVSVALVGLGIFLLYKSNSKPLARVWHLWLFSFVAFNMSFLMYASLEDHSRVLLHTDLNETNSFFHYLRLVPVWLLISFAFIQTYVKQGLVNELQHLRQINLNIEQLHQDPPASKISDTSKLSLSITSNLRAKDIPLHQISHISVDDHYCYIHYQDDAKWHKTDVGKPLKALNEELNSDFLQIHRSHIINAKLAEGLKKQGRNYLVRMPNNVILPISRSQTADVLNQLEHLTA